METAASTATSKVWALYKSIDSFVDKNNNGVIEKAVPEEKYDSYTDINKDGVIVEAEAKYYIRYLYEATNDEKAQFTLTESDVAVLRPIFNEAVKNALLIKEADSRDDAVVNLITDMTRATLFNEAIEAAKTLSESGRKAIVIVAVVIDMPRSPANYSQILPILSEAYTYAKNSLDHKIKTAAFGAIASLMGECGGDKATINNIMEEAGIAATQIQDPDDKFSAVRVLADCKSFATAVSIAKTFTDKSKVADLLNYISTKMADAGQFNEALALARSIEDTAKRSEALAAIAMQLGLKMLFKEAMNVAKTIEDPKHKDSALRSIALKMSEGIYLNDALVIARSISDASRKASTLYEIASKLLSDNPDVKTAGDILREAHEAAKMIADPYDKASILISIAENMNKAKADKANISVVFNEAITAANAITDKDMRGYKLDDIFRQLLNAEMMPESIIALTYVTDIGARITYQEQIIEKDLGKSSYKDAIGLARAIDDPIRKARSISKIALAMSLSGDKSTISELINEAYGIMMSTAADPSAYKADALTNISTLMVKHDFDKNTAIGVTKDALATVKTFSDPYNSNISQVIENMCALGLLADALAAANDIPDQAYKERGIAMVVSAMAKEKRFTEALLIVKDIKDPWRKANSLLDISSAMIDAKTENSSIRIILDEANSNAKIVTDPYLKAKVMTSIAGQMITAGLDKSATIAILNGAYASTDPIENGGCKAVVRKEVVVKFIELGMLPEALAMARSLEDPDYRADVMMDILDKMVEIGAKRDDVIGLIKELYGASMTLKSNYYKTNMLKKLPQHMINYGIDRTMISDCLREALKMCILTDHDGFYNYYGFETIAENMASIGMFSEAAEAAKRISDTGTKCDTLINIATKMADATLFRRAQEDPSVKRAEDIKFAVSRMTVSTIFREALNTAATDEQINSIISKMIDATLFDEAIAAAASIKDPVTKTNAQKDIVTGLLIAGSYDKARELASSLPSSDSDEQLFQIANEMAIYKQFNGALEVCDGLIDPEHRSTALRIIATNMIKAKGDKNVIKKALMDSLKYAKEIKESEVDKNVCIYVTLTSMVEAGMFEEAFEAVKALQGTKYFPSGLLEIASGLSASGTDKKTVKTVIDEAISSSRALTDADDQARALSFAAKVIVKCGFDKKEASALLSEAAKLYEAQPRSTYGEPINISLDMVEAGFVNEGLGLIRANDDIPIQISWLCDAAVLLSKKSKDNPLIAALFDEAIALSKKGKEDNSLDTLKEISLGMADAGLFKRAIAMAKTIEDGIERSSHLSHIVPRMAKAKMFNEALQVVNDITAFPYAKGNAQSEIALEMARAGLYNRSLELIASIQDFSLNMRNCYQREVLVMMAENKVKAATETKSPAPVKK